MTKYTKKKQKVANEIIWKHACQAGISSVF